MMNSMMVSGGAGGKVSLLLLALAAGYAVLVLANKQSRPLDVLGRIVGVVILLVSIAGLVCVAACSVKCRMASTCSSGAMAKCDMSAKKDCPYTGSMGSAPSAVAPMDGAPK